MLTNHEMTWHGEKDSDSTIQEDSMDNISIIIEMEMKKNS